MSNNPAPPPLHKAFLLAVQWYGDAIQDLNELFSFVKFYVAIETAIKKSKESAKAAVPRRLSVLVEPFDKQRQRMIEADIGDLIDERNASFHSGTPSNRTIEYLAWFARVMSMQTLHHLRLRIEREGFTTEDDLEAWADSQFQKFLA